VSVHRMQRVVYRKQGESGIVVELGNEVDPQINAQVHGLCQKIHLNLSAVIEAVVPTYRSLYVLFDPLLISRQMLIEAIDKNLLQLPAGQKHEKAARGVVIPTLYGGDEGPDLDFVARHNQLAVEQVIAIHTSVSYQIYMIGFTPGFPYLGGMSEKIAAPRLTTPRSRIAAGSVGIAGSQTGLYPQASPGGWQIIGRTPLKVFNPAKNEPFLYKAGDYLRFESITEKDFTRILYEQEVGTFEPQFFQQPGVGP
jgi:inhibitor of KinA